MPLERPRRTPAAALLSVLLLVGCSDDGPQAQDFAAGTCRAVAPEVLELRSRVGDLGDGPRVANDDKAALKGASDRLRETARGATGPELPELDDVVQAVGLLRLRADGDTYEPALADDVRAAADRLVARCTEP